MHCDIGAETERLLQVRGRERVVDDDPRTPVLRKLRRRRDVDHGEERVRRRLDPDELRLVAPRTGERVEISEVDRRPGDPGRLVPLLSNRLQLLPRSEKRLSSNPGGLIRARRLTGVSGAGCHEWPLQLAEGE